MAFDLKDRIAGRFRTLMSSAPELGDKQASVLAIASNKGGVGKTTTSVALAIALARSGAKTLLIDLDPQAHVSASLRAQPNGQLADVLLGKMRDVCEATYPSAWPNLDLAGSEKSLAETDAMIAAKIGKELLLAGALAIARTRYDAILIDCPPNLGTLTLNALCAADFLLVPTDMSVLALEGVGDILSVVETLRTRLHRNIEVCGIVATRFDKRTTQLNTAIETSFEDLYGNAAAILETRIPQSSAVNKAHLAGEPLVDHAPSSPAAKAYTLLAHEVACRIGLGRFLGEPIAETDAHTARVG
ncbi:MAG: ParA family protein [Clostridia bacterium]|nr:ParA family protein [Deltaproteobacteria bacterium]